MGANKKSRSKGYRPRQVCIDSAAWAISGSFTLPISTQRELMAPVDTAMRQLQMATANRDDWNVLANGLNIAEALCGQNIGNNLLSKILSGQSALHAVAIRMIPTGSSTCKGCEITDILEAVDMYRIQLNLCSQAELSRAVRRVKNLHRSGAMADVAKIYEKMAAL